MTKTAKKTIIICAASVAAVMLALVAFAAPYLLSGARQSATIHVYPDMTTDVLADSISSVQTEAFGSRVATLLSLLDVDLAKRAGAYAVEEGESPLSIARKIRNKHQLAIKFTFQNVRTKNQLAERASTMFMMNKADLLKLLDDSTFCASMEKNVYTIANVFLPDSYEFYWAVSPEDFVKGIAKYAVRFWTDERKAKAVALGLTPDEVCTIASIVEEETAKSDERGKVSRLYINRYKQGMKLQADPTVKFALGDFGIRRITHAMLTCDSPYNTYKFEGLPPGPIRLPEKSTIDAVLNAPEHNFTYMCAKEDFSGYHNFTDNYATHLANARRYQAELNKRGIK